MSRITGVSLATAKLNKSGQRKASRAVLRLFTLHRDGRVLGSAWKGWKASKDSIADPDGNVTSVRQLAMYFFVMQYAAALAARDPGGQFALAKVISPWGEFVPSTVPIYPLRLATDLRARAQANASDLGISLNALIAQALEGHLESTRHGSARLGAKPSGASVAPSVRPRSPARRPPRRPDAVA